MASSVRSIIKGGSSSREMTESKTDSESEDFGIKKVYFDQIYIREYPIILGDNPAVSEGAPVTIGWDCMDEYEVNLSMYEYTKGPMRRTRKKLMLSSKKRTRFLVEAGYSPMEIGDAIVDVEKAKLERLRSVQAFGWNGRKELLSGVVETSGAALRGVARRGSKILLKSVAAAVSAIKIKHPKRSSFSPPAC